MMIKIKFFLVQNEPFPVFIVYPEVKKKVSKRANISPGVVVRTANKQEYTHMVGASQNNSVMPGHCPNAPWLLSYL